jgi:hypothetical protein
MAALRVIRTESESVLYGNDRQTPAVFDGSIALVARHVCCLAQQYLKAGYYVCVSLVRQRCAAGLCPDCPALTLSIPL